ncbi:MAG: inorganic phosphate transporter [Xanthomonadales bacterium]|nr:inorganic phosphate transporter [Xanthomonadales bacterium]NIN58631.1 inorganic phosphate transporter [Xanthomonadales bacterium]NIN73920.1 inorganic phosphate transporter [Xanthomonadales bacterium]NIO12389.1 inorganic phosphate transporter [Xanthomonadales bacterium]NIP11024.1 inorganic phosphate transporter [Xanthomonadales bacterium]
MEALLPVILILAGFYVGWNIGANDAANCIGTTVGAQIISYRKAVAIMALFVVLGGVLQGHHVMKTVGKGIVISDVQAWEQEHGEPPPATFQSWFPDNRLPDRAILVALLSAGLFVTLATFSSVPVSTSQAIVGGVAGTGIGIVGMQAAYFKLGVLLKIFGAWVISPALTLVLAFLVYQGLGLLLRRTTAVYWSQLMAIAVVGSSAYVSYSLGANDVGNAIGPLLSKYPDKGAWLALLGGLAMALGAITFGSRVTHTVGKSITPLDYPGALAAQLSAAFGVHLFSMAGIPVSTSQAVVGGVIGVGLTKGMRAVSRRKITTIFLGWVITPLCAAIFAALLYRLLA